MRDKTFARKPVKCAHLTPPDEHEDMGAETINEVELIDNLATGTVSKMTLVQTEDQKFVIYVQLTWKGGQLLLETQRKKPRIWSSLDRLVKHINTKYGPVPDIELHLWRDNEHEERKPSST